MYQANTDMVTKLIEISTIRMKIVPIQSLLMQYKGIVLSVVYPFMSHNITINLKVNVRICCLATARLIALMTTSVAGSP